MLLARALRRHLKIGTIEIVGPGGSSEVVAATREPRLRVRVRDRATARRLLLAPSYHIAESYVNGCLLIEDGTLADLLACLMGSLPDDRMPTWLDRIHQVFEPVLDRISGVGRLGRARRDVQFHYDLSNEFFALFLDPSLQYSCAYFRSPDESLAEAQQAKMRHIAAKLRLGAGQSVLDIGCGWGALAGFISETYDAHVDGVTLSRNQLALARERWASPRAAFELRDYRTIERRYDRIVSVGMLEHVGRDHIGGYFGRIAGLLAADGVALVHTIGRRGPPMPVNPWIRRRIFPGSYLPSLSQLTAAVEANGLWMLDCENLRVHYAWTLARWREALMRHREHIALKFGDRFLRAWEFYLVACEQAFQVQGLTVYQLLLGRRPDAVPLTRDFMHDEERRLARRTAKTGRKPGIAA